MQKTMIRAAICGLLLCLIAPGAYSQDTLTLTPSTTYQTWRGFGTTVGDKWSDQPACVNISDELQNTLMNWLVFSAGHTRVRIPLNNSATRVNLPGDDGSGNPDTFLNPGTLEPYATRLAANWAFGTCTRSYAAAAAAGKIFYNRVLSRGSIPEMNLSQLNNEGWTGMPTEWKDVTNGNGYHTKGIHATIQWTYNQYGYWLTTFTVNEPTSSSGWFLAGGGAANYYGGSIIYLKNRLTAAGIPTTWEAPTMVAGSSTETQLALIDDVVGAKEALSRFLVHCYACPDPTQSAAILADAIAFGKETGMDELYPGATGITTDTFASGVTFISGYVYPMLKNLSASSYSTVSAWFACPTSNPTCDPTVSGVQSDTGMRISSDGTTFYLNPNYFAWYQLVHYALRPGFVRIECATSNSNVPCTGWKRPDGTLVIVILQYNGSTRNLTVNGLNNTLHDIFRADGTQCTTTGFTRCTPTATTGTPSGGSLALSSVPTNAIWTLSERPTRPY